jgi:aspartate aminotransferase
VIIDTVSKRYSACGARLGCMITKNKQVYQTALKFAQARLSAGMVEQMAGTAAIDTPPAYFSRVIKEYSARRDTVVNALNNMEGVYCPNPGGAFYVMAQLPVDDSDKFCRWMLEEFSYDNQTVMMAPASGFYTTAGAGQHQVRIAYVLNNENLKKAMHCLEMGLKAYPGRTVKVEVAVGAPQFAH